MSGILKSDDLSLDELLNLLSEETISCSESDSGSRSGGRTRCFVECPDGWSFDWWPGLNEQLHFYTAGRLAQRVDAKPIVSRSTAGRIFAPSAELRWRRFPTGGDATYRCVFLGSVDWVGSRLNDASNELSNLKPDRDRYLVWGQQSERTPGEWIELRIPHRFRYPIDGNPSRVVLEVEYWKDPARRPQFIRYCDLHPYQENQ
ncbi:MAG: hypothetical protein KatS3mg105_5132 [Gemmatales bacterium]|nr:MAG: hypothetical protein KatS3mg105_5132 [Gemmatales bacterium]GIW97856.1 MAG: hypothetical protein KatS3mg111_1189 [Pirellulaceae bacterium]